MLKFQNLRANRGSIFKVKFELVQIWLSTVSLRLNGLIFHSLHVFSNKIKITPPCCIILEFEIIIIASVLMLKHEPRYTLIREENQTTTPQGSYYKNKIPWTPASP